MARRPTRFERDLADLHGDAGIEIVEMQPAGGPGRYRAVTTEKSFMADYPPFVRMVLGLLGMIWGLGLIALSLVGLGAVLFLLWFFLIGPK